MRVRFMRHQSSTRPSAAHLTLGSALAAALLPSLALAQTNPPPPMQAGGLAPPPPPASRPPSRPSPTETALAEAERSDSGRGLEFFYIEPEVGASYVALEALHGPLFPAGVKSSAVGPSVGVAA